MEGGPGGHGPEGFVKNVGEAIATFREAEGVIVKPLGVGFVQFGEGVDNGEVADVAVVVAGVVVAAGGVNKDAGGGGGEGAKGVFADNAVVGGGAFDGR